MNWRLQFRVDLDSVEFAVIVVIHCFKACFIQFYILFSLRFLGKMIHTPFLQKLDSVRE